MGYKDLIYGVDEQIATITLNRPEQIKALRKGTPAKSAPDERRKIG